MNYDPNWGTLKPVSTFGLQNTGAPGLKMPVAPSPYMDMGQYSQMPPVDYSLTSAQIPALNTQGYGAGLATTNLVGGGTGMARGPGTLWDSFLQQRGADGTTSGGWGQAGLGILQGVGGLYLGMQQYNLAKDALATSKEQFNRQFEVNKNLTNSRLEDRQRARVASNSGAYQSVGDYMNQNGVK